MRYCGESRGKKGSKIVRESDSKGSSGDEFLDAMGWSSSNQ